MNAKFSMFLRANASKFLAMFIGIGWLGFEYTNFVTTNRALAGIMGGNDISAALALAIAAIDFGGLARIATPSITRKTESKVVKALFGAWVMVAMINALLTWWDLAYLMEMNAFHGPSSVIVAGIQWFVPVALAILVFVVRFILISVFGSVLDSAINGRGVAASHVSNNATVASRHEHRTPDGFHPLSTNQIAVDRVLHGGD